MAIMITQMYEYGYYGYNVFELPTLGIDVARLPKVDIGSKVGVTVNAGSRTALVDVDINTGDYYKTKTNEGDYENLIDFIKTNQIGRIPRISSTVKVLLYYTLTTADGATVDAGARISEVPMVDCVQLMPMVEKIFAPYRLAKHSSANFVIDRFNTDGGTNIRTPFPLHPQAYPISGEHAYTLYIDAIRVLGTEIGKDRSIPKSMNGGHYAIGSQTLLDIERNSIELFSSVWYDLKFNSVEIPAYVHAISIPVEVVTPMIATTDPKEIDTLLETNSEEFYPGEVPGEIVVDMFKPLIHRPPCPGSLPHDYFKYWDKRPDHCHHEHGPCVHPIHPGPEWPNHGELPKIDVNNIDKDTPPGVYTNSGVLKYGWKDLIAYGAIQISYKGDATCISTPDQRVKGAKITPDDIGPILVIPSPENTTAMRIAESAFFGYGYLEAVYLPAEVRVIEPHAFYSCGRLETVKSFATGMDGIVRIEDNAFMNCMALRSLNTTLALDTIGCRAFYHCSLLALRVPPSVTRVGANAFHEVFKVICSPKLDLADSGIDPMDATFFEKDDPWYNPDDYKDPDVPDEGGNNKNEGTGDGGGNGSNSGEPEQKPENPGSGTGSDSETGSGDNASGGNSGNNEGKTPETGSDQKTPGGLGEGEVGTDEEDR